MLRTSLRIALCTLACLGFIRSPTLRAQSSGNQLRGEFPELVALFDAFDVTQGAMYDRLLQITESGESGDAQNELREALTMRASMSMSEMMQVGPGDVTDMDRRMGPFGRLETEAMSELYGMIQGRHSPREIRAAFSTSGALTERAARVLQRGREFEARIFDIYVDNGITDKFVTVNEAIENYVSDLQASVAPHPKDPRLMYGHPFAGAFKAGYPRVSGLYWASQWLKLASFEPLMVGSEVASGVSTTIDRFEGKLGDTGGMTTAPSEIPMVPGIAPLLLHRHPEAAWIIDNLNVLEVVIADLLVHPDVTDRDGSIDAVVEVFTDRESNIMTGLGYRDYLLSALRTGIYNQGGPALGELAGSERNRSRMEMEMGGHIVLPGMN